MVFSDPIFLFAFLPATFILFHLTRGFWRGTPALILLVLASCGFYAYWSVPFLGLLLAQILANYGLGHAIQNEEAPSTRRLIMVAAVILNLALLGYFKYRNFFFENLMLVTGYHFVLHALIVPLAISFHTFQQIALLADVNDDEADMPPLLNYVFFVTFFPQLIAGPIVLHREMGKQVEALRNGESPGLSFLGPGIFLLIYGLFKKVYLADKIAPFVDGAFMPGMHLNAIEAWLAAVAYALQIYFDFSGYSDMAVGLGLMFGFRLPTNFLIPYRATSVIEYWRRWHITMTRFFTMYVYMPLALNFSRLVRRNKVGSIAAFALTTVIPTFVAFLASGLWHGAGWTFIFMGLTFAIAITINQAWREAKAPSLPSVVAWSLTAITVLIADTFFRSPSLRQAFDMLWSMANPHAIGSPRWAPTQVAAHLPVIEYQWLNAGTAALTFLGTLVILAPLAFLMPAYAAEAEKLRPSLGKALGAAVMLCLSMSVLSQPRSFLYFAF